MRQNHVAGQRDGKRSVYPSFNAVHAIGMVCCPQSLSFQLQRRRAGLGVRAAAFGCSLWVSGILLGLFGDCAPNQLERMPLRGKVAQPAPGFLSISFASF